MAITAVGDVFVPQVIGDLATDILFKQVPLLQSGLVVPANPISADAGGSTITFPTWTTTVSGLVQDSVVDNRTGVTPSKVAMTTYTESVLSKIISIDMDSNVITDIAASAGLNSHIAEIVANASGDAIQSLLISKAEGTGLSHDTTAASTKTVTVDHILQAKMKRGDRATMGGMPALFLHSKQFTDLASTADFKTLASAANPAIVQAGGLPPGTVAIVHGVAIIPMDAVSVATVPNPDQYTGLMVWPGALQLYIKKAVTAKAPFYHPSSNVVTLDFDFRYAATLYRMNPRGVVKLITE